MLIGEDGTTLGMLSGGCLESDLVQRARRYNAIDIGPSVKSGSDGEHWGLAQTIHYDSTDEDDFLHALGLGCGGVVDILLQTVERGNHYLKLDTVLDLLNAGQAVHYQQQIRPVEREPLQAPARGISSLHRSRNDAAIAVDSKNDAIAWRYQGRAFSIRSQANLKKNDSLNILDSLIPRRVRLGIFGLGDDAKPLARMALSLGWQVITLDSRPSSKANSFAATLAKQSLPVVSDVRPLDQLTLSDLALDAAIVMHHSLELDTEALKLLQKIQLGYCALLGPPHRRDEVLDRLGQHASNLPWPFFGPAGFDIGAELPETIALSILAQCHSTLYEA